MNQHVAVVIEDDPDICLLVSTILQGMGYTVHTAMTGPAGIHGVRDLQPELITTDLDLPGLGGVEVIRTIREFSTAPVLVISGNNDVTRLEDAIAAGADAYLPKPFLPRTLREHVGALHHTTPQP